MDAEQLRKIAETHTRMVRMIKDVNRDVIMYCNENAAALGGATAAQVIGTHSSRYFPDYAEFAKDDRAAVASGFPRGPFLETVRDNEGNKTCISTVKVPFTHEGVSYVWVEAIELPALISDSTPHGFSFDLRGISEHVSELKLLTQEIGKYVD